MSNFRAGFGRVNVNPMMGIDIVGYYKKRKADGILDDLEINALALECGGKKTVFMCIDNCGLKKVLLDEIRTYIAEKMDIDKGAIFFSATHTHTGPMTLKDSDNPLVQEYIQFITHRAIDVVKYALDDLKPAKMGWGIGQAPNVAFVRRYRMKDGSTQTNPGVNNPDIVGPIGEVDENVNVLRFDREGAQTLILVNFANHPDVVGGCKISADWPGLLRKKVEKALDNTKCIFFNGAQGDVNHVNVHPKDGDLNGMFMDFDDVSRGYAHAHHIANVVTGGVLQVYEKVKYVDVDEIKYEEKIVNVPSNMPSPEEITEARRINELHLAGKDSELPYSGMMLTTVVAEAARMVLLENGPEAFEMPLTGVVVGPVAFLGVPGEPFTGVGRGIKETKGFDVILVSCLTNGFEGYFPMKDAYDEGGYEARCSRFKVGVAEFIIEEAQKLLTKLGNNK